MTFASPLAARFAGADGLAAIRQGAQMRLVQSMLMRRFKLSLACEPQDIDEEMAFTMLPSRMPVQLTVRT